MAEAVKTEEPKVETTVAAAQTAAPEPVKVEPAKEVPATSLLSEPAKEPVKAAEPGPAAKTAETLKADAKIEDAKAIAAEPAKLGADGKPIEAAPPEYKFKLPEGVTLDDKELGKFTQILGKNHASPEFAQELMDLYTTEAGAMVERFVTEQRKAWSETNDTWIQAVRADPEIGGNRIDTVLQATRQLVGQFGGDANQQAELRKMLAMTGAGNHPAMARFLYRIATALGEGTPVPAPTPKASPDKTNLSRAQRRYGGNSAAT